MLTRISQAAGGLVSLLLIARFFSPEVQGFFYTFSSLIALQAFVELGLYLVIVNFASHEWSKLHLDASGRVVGDVTSLSRLASLAKFIAKWYLAASVLFVLGIGIGGYLFLSGSGPTQIPWQSAWWSLIAIAALQLWLTSILSLLEGCNQIVALSRFRFLQAVIEMLVMWFLVVAGAGLWVAVGYMAVRVTVTSLFLVKSYRRFFYSLWTGAENGRINWKTEIWPMQWRLAAQGMVNYLMFSLFVPVMFHYHGSEVAGKMGMTLQIAGVAQLIALGWLQTKIPRFGMLVARRDFSELDRIWRQVSMLSFGLAALGSLALWMGVFALNQFEFEIASRILGPLPTGLFLLANLLTLISNYQASYLRAHAREPFLVAGVTGGILIGGLVFLFGSRYGPTGAGAAYLAALALFVLPMTTAIWLRRRIEWQGRQ